MEEQLQAAVIFSWTLLRESGQVTLSGQAVLMRPVCSQLTLRGMPSSTPALRYIAVASAVVSLENNHGDGRADDGVAVALQAHLHEELLCDDLVKRWKGCGRWCGRPCNPHPGMWAP